MVYFDVVDDFGYFRFFDIKIKLFSLFFYVKRIPNHSMW